MGGPARGPARTRVEWAPWNDPPPSGGTSGSAARARDEKGPGSGGRGSGKNQDFELRSEPTVTPTAGKGKRPRTPRPEGSAPSAREVPLAIAFLGGSFGRTETRSGVEWAPWNDPPSASAGGTSGSAARAPNEKVPGCGGPKTQNCRGLPLEPTITPTAGKGKRSGTPLRERSAPVFLPAFGGFV